MGTSNCRYSVEGAHPASVFRALVGQLGETATHHSQRIHLRGVSLGEHDHAQIVEHADEDVSLAHRGKERLVESMIATCEAIPGFDEPGAIEDGAVVERVAEHIEALFAHDEMAG